MAPISWAVGPKHTLINDNLSLYEAAVTEGKKAIKRFWPVFVSQFYGKFPLKNELVDDGRLDARVLADDYDMTAAETEIFSKAMETRNTQIKTLFRYLHKKKHGNAPAARVHPESKKALTEAAKVFVTKKRRCHHRPETYYRLNQDWLDPIIQTEMDALKAAGGEVKVEDGNEQGALVEDDTGKMVEVSTLEVVNRAAAKKKGWNLKVRGDVIKRYFDEASEDDLRVVAEAIIQEKEEMERAADLRRSGSGLAREAELRAEALDKINAFLVDNAKMYWDYAGMATITVGVAPDPRTQRRVAYGRDVNGKLITDIDPTLAGKIVKQLRTWAKASLFTTERFAAAQGEHQEGLVKLEGEGSASATVEEGQVEGPAQDVVLYDDELHEGAKESGTTQAVPTASQEDPKEAAPATPPALTHRIINRPKDDTHPATQTTSSSILTTQADSNTQPSPHPSTKSPQKQPAAKNKHVVPASSASPSPPKVPTDVDGDIEGDGGRTKRTVHDPALVDTLLAFGGDDDDDDDDDDYSNKVDDTDKEDADPALGGDGNGGLGSAGNDEEFDAEKFWAGLDTNIPDPAETAKQATSAKKVGAAKAKGSKTKKTNTKKSNAAKSRAGRAQLVPKKPVLDTKSPDSAAGKGEAPKAKAAKRKTPPIEDPAPEEGRGKRARTGTKLGDGTVFAGTSKLPMAVKETKKAAGGKKTTGRGGGAGASKAKVATKKAGK